MFKRILVPVDGSRTSNLGLDKAIGLAREHGATLCLLHVMDTRVVAQGFAGGTASAIDRLFDSLHDSGKRILASAEARARGKRIRVTSVLVENIARSVADVIVSNARKWRADVIVIGTHGRRGISRLVMGSDAEGVVRTSPVPVLLVRSKAGKRG